MRYYTNFQLKNYNSFRLESIAKEIWFPETENELRKLIVYHTNHKFHLIAGGTNLILAPTLNRVICLKLLPHHLEIYKNSILVTTNYNTSKFITIVLQRGFSNLENLIGIPGTIGGAITMNAGSGTSSITDYLKQIVVCDYKNDIIVLSKTQLQPSRRFTTLQKNQGILLQAEFLFEYGEINQQKLDNAIIHRSNIPKYPSAGGIFLNWHVLKSHSHNLIGLNVKDAEVSDHPNIIINKGHATFYDIIALITRIQNRIPQQLFLEVKILQD